MSIEWTKTGTTKLIQGPGANGLTCYEFDGTDDYISSPALGNIGADFTILMWLRGSADGYLFDFQEGSGTGHASWVASTGAISGSSGTVYVNGAASTTAPQRQWNLIAISGMAVDSTTSFIIGAQSTPANYITGVIAGVKIYDRSLTQAEIELVYQQELPLMSDLPAMVAHYDMGITPDAYATYSSGNFIRTNDPSKARWAGDGFVVCMEVEISAASSAGTMYARSSSFYMNYNASNGKTYLDIAGIGYIGVVIGSPVGKRLKLVGIFNADRGLLSVYDVGAESALLTGSRAGGSHSMPADQLQFGRSYAVTTSDLIGNVYAISFYRGASSKTSATDLAKDWVYGDATSIGMTEDDLIFRTPGTGANDQGFTFEEVGTLPSVSILTDQEGSHPGVIAGAVQAAGRKSLNGLDMTPALYFNGSSDVVTADLLPVSGGVASYSLWIKFNETPTATQHIFTNGSITTWNLLASYYTTQGLTAGFRNSANNYAYSYVQPVVGMWHHLVGTYDGVTRKVYIDGVLKGTGTTGTGNLSAITTGDLTLGYGSTYFKGNMDDLRFYQHTLTQEEISSLYYIKTTTGTPAEYTSAPDPVNYSLSYDGYDTTAIPFGASPSQIKTALETIPEFAPTTVPANVQVDYVGIDSYTKLLLHMDDAGLTDSSGSAHTPTLNGGVTMTATESKFGGYSAYFDGTDDTISYPNHADFRMGSGDFTIDGWVKMGASASTRMILGLYNSYSVERRSWIVQCNGTANLLRFITSGDGTSSGGFDILASTTAVNDNVWHHFAFVRSGNTKYVFIDGIKEAEVSYTSSLYENTTDDLYVGSEADNGAYFDGYIDELRVSKGIARWTENFVPPGVVYNNSNRITFIGDKAKTSIVSDLSTNSDVPLGGIYTLVKVQEGGPQEYWSVANTEGSMKLVQIFQDNGDSTWTEITENGDLVVEYLENSDQIRVYNQSGIDITANIKAVKWG